MSSATHIEPFEHPLSRGRAPEWASAWGEDRFGPWAAFEIGGVEQRMRWAPEGTFWMGAPVDEAGRYPDEGPQRLVRLSRGFWIFETPCRQALWNAVMPENPSQFHGDERPVDSVTWDECRSFAEAVNQRLPGLKLRLPTEAEWEYACRAGSSEARYGELDQIAWYVENALNKSLDVGQKGPNVWGLHDMLGNVCEWVQDSWTDDYENAKNIDPLRDDGDSTRRVIRGGSYFNDARDVRAACRDGWGPSHRDCDRGFRCASSE